MKTFFKTATCISLFALLMGCGNDGQGDLYKGFWNTTKAAVPSKKRDAETQKASALEAAILSKLNQPLIMATTDRLNIPLIKVSENGPYEQWHTPGKIAVTFREGFMTATRGLGGDLMNADVEESLVLYVIARVCLPS